MASQIPRFVRNLRFTPTGRDGGFKTRHFDRRENGVTHYYYDALNRLTKSINDEISEQYAYNKANQLVTRQVGGSGEPTKEITVSGDVSDTENPPFSGVEAVTVVNDNCTFSLTTITLPYFSCCLVLWDRTCRRFR